MKHWFRDKLKNHCWQLLCQLSLLFRHCSRVTPGSVFSGSYGMPGLNLGQQYARLMSYLLYYLSSPLSLLFNLDIQKRKSEKKNLEKTKATFYSLRTLNFKFKDNQNSPSVLQFGIQAWFLDVFPIILKSWIWFDKQLSQLFQLMKKSLTFVTKHSQLSSWNSVQQLFLLRGTSQPEIFSLRSFRLRH